jgi:alpha-L-fucosidase 2
MLVVDINELAVGKKRAIVLGPAIPRAWGRGSVKGLRLRGGGIVDFEWDEEGVVRSVAKAVEGVKFFNRAGTTITSK